MLFIEFFTIPLSALIFLSLGSKNNLKVKAKRIKITDKKNNFLYPMSLNSGNLFIFPATKPPRVDAIKLTEDL